MPPYIGITGFMSMFEVARVLDEVPSDSDRRLMVGVLASSKTLAGGTNKHPGRYPPRQSINLVFMDDPRTLNLIHYATDDKTTLAAQLGLLMDIGGDLLQGFQLNIAWPEPKQLEQARRRGAKFVLQVGGRALELVERDPKRLANRVADCAGLIDHVLLDPSGGRGQPFDPVAARMYLTALAERLPTLGLGVAGGLSGRTLHLVEPLIRDFPDLNIDAEGRLRDPVDDHLSLDLAREYAAAAFRLFAR